MSAGIGPSEGVNGQTGVVRAARIVCILELLFIAASGAMNGWENGVSTFALGLALLAVAGVAGLLQWLAWGRRIADLFSVLAALGLCGGLMPDLDAPRLREDGSPSWLMEGWPTWLAWVTVVGISTIPLLPALALGWRRHAFRRAWW